MKKCLLILLLVWLGAVPTRAQSGSRGLWCPPGAQWLHMSIWVGTAGPVLTPIRTSYVGDTIINGQSCQVLHRQWAGAPAAGRIYTRADADQVWLYANRQFYKMQDFSARPGDSWLYLGTPVGRYYCVPVLLTVDSVGQRLVGGQVRRWFVAHYQDGLDVVSTRRVYEGVGDLQGDLFPAVNMCMVAAVTPTLAPQCYGTAAQPGLIVMGTMLNCQGLPTATPETRAKAAGFAVYPSISSGEVMVKLPAAYSRATLSMFSPTGQLLRQLALPASTETRLQLGPLPRGLYLLRVQQSDQPLLTQRVLLQ
jgi:hypothetical protein